MQSIHVISAVAPRNSGSRFIVWNASSPMLHGSRKHVVWPRSTHFHLSRCKARLAVVGK
jgi:hypothetical protein